MARSCYDCCDSCERCIGCQDCNTCEGCQSCQGECVNCQKCVGGCEATCDSAQTFCIQGKETIAEACGQGSFAFSYRPTQDTGIMGPGYFDKSVQDELSTWISARANLPIESPTPIPKGGGGTTNSNGGSTVSASAVAAVAPFSAAEFNKIANEIDGPTVNVNDLITSSLFLQLEAAANSKTVNSDACAMCNANCDNDCNECQKCNSCQGCEKCENCNTGCQGCNACESCVYCDGGCDDCQSCDSCDGGCQSACESNEKGGGGR